MPLPPVSTAGFHIGCFTGTGGGGSWAEACMCAKHACCYVKKIPNSGWNQPLRTFWRAFEVKCVSMPCRRVWGSPPPVQNLHNVIETRPALFFGQQNYVYAWDWGCTNTGIEVSCVRFSEIGIPTSFNDGSIVWRFILMHILHKLESPFVPDFRFHDYPLILISNYKG